MSISVTIRDERVAAIRFPRDRLEVELKDGRVLSVPLTWFPRLQTATPEQRANWEVIAAGYGIHWPEVDEDLSVEGLLRGVRAPAV
jgi:hypothetical protein